MLLNARMPGVLMPAEAAFSLKVALPLTMGMANRWMDWSLASHLQTGRSKAAERNRSGWQSAYLHLRVCRAGRRQQRQQPQHTQQSGGQPAANTHAVCLHHTCSWAQWHSRHSNSMCAHQYGCLALALSLAIAMR